MTGSFSKKSLQQNVASVLELKIEWLVIRINAYIPALIKPGKEVFHHGMVDRFQDIIGFQVLFSYIGGLIAPMNQYMVPGLVFWRAGFCNRLVPFFGCLEIMIDIHNDSAVVEKAMVHQFTNAEPDFCDIRYSSHVVLRLLS